ncbi:MAG: hypothetical protein UX94_C0011G0026 [Parcubacteria group bacterium GW2011_GWA2_47_21]|nr:MAG: hypothetical protein UX94_C0011G0026 [Parcubacteria group bacterium GW2011_GWA2_47_21]
MDFQKTTVSITLVFIALFTAGLVSAKEFYFNVPKPNLRNLPEISVSKVNDDAGGTSITNDISVSASTGGNNVSGGSGQSGGTIQTGSAKAEVKIQTTVNGEVIEDFDEEYEGEAEIEKEFENASGTVKTRVEVKVRSGTSTAGNLQPTTLPLPYLPAGRWQAGNNQQQELLEEKEKSSWFLKIWPFGEEVDEAKPRHPDKVLPRSDFSSSSPTTSPEAFVSKDLPTNHIIRQAIQNFFKNLFSIFRI